ncbi:peptidoglycan DD-metalloendopeptidase family protein [Virgibacillus sp. MSP4-1]|uniref:murein hydrolase activator EnvC family protein n=1 Tax=Virgibacillus sp. MSP4-1 TaxID=2700081 RepID=UPI0003A0026C|nr:M23 family metallopeptidase [Virgibacillus sp. MSP4-1]QHS23270.1 peptidoglycan DD-metalloendopeptidase family protein [Virgibacillus sp. MSP4-1]
MKNRIFSVLSILMLLAVTFSFSGSEKTYATSAGDLRDEIDDLENKQDSVKDEKEELESSESEIEEKIEKNQAKQDRILGQIEEIDQEVAKTQKNIENTEEEISKTEKEIKKLKENIKETKKRIAKRDELLENRLRTMQRNGGSVSYLEVLLGAQDFGDFLTRTNAVSKIMDSDKKILEEQKAEKEQLEKDKAEVEKKKEELVAKKDELESAKERLDEQKQEKSDLVAKLKQEEKELHEHKMSLQEKQQILQKQQEAYNRMIEQKKDKLEQLSTPPSSSGGNGQFIRPAQGYITSEFGGRWGGMHNGMDISKYGKIPIKASASGMVYRAYRSSSYGNVVYITHSMGGQQYTTLYAHMRYYTVSEGQYVQKGQVIGYMGNTGNSTGQHLHFELHEGPWNYSKSNAVNPRKYISF